MANALPPHGPPNSRARDFPALWCPNAVHTNSAQSSLQIVARFAQAARPWQPAPKEIWRLLRSRQIRSSCAFLTLEESHSTPGGLLPFPGANQIHHPGNHHHNTHTHEDHPQSKLEPAGFGDIDLLVVEALPRSPLPFTVSETVCSPPFLKTCLICPLSGLFAALHVSVVPSSNCHSQDCISPVAIEVSVKVISFPALGAVGVKVKLATGFAWTSITTVLTTPSGAAPL